MENLDKFKYPSCCFGTGYYITYDGDGRTAERCHQHCDSEVSPKDWLKIYRERQREYLLWAKAKWPGIFVHVDFNGNKVEYNP